MEELLMEEIVVVQSIFAEELSLSEEGKVIQFRIKGDLVLTLKISGNYPEEIPLIVLPDHLEAVGFHQHLHSSIKDLIGSPMLFQLLNAANEWIEARPFSLNATPVSNSSPSNEVQSSSNKDPSNTVCKFFAKGNCRFGSKCKSYHPDSKFSRQTDEESGASLSVSQPQDSQQVAAMSDNADENSHLGSKKKQPMRTASDVISRILWDPDIQAEECTIGYLDRFVGIIEKPFGAFSWEDLSTVANNVLAIPKHRIQYFKYQEEIIWDKRIQLDNVFGSRGGKLIQDIVQAYKKEMPSGDSGERPSSETAEASNISTSLRKWQEDRPTHFVCIRITNEEILSNVKEIQNSIVSQCPDLADACLHLTALHVTVCVVQVKKPSHFEAAKAVLEDTKKYFVQFLPKCTNLVFTGVNNFRDRVLYAKVAPNAALEKYSSFLIERFKGAGLKTPGNHAKFTPHMTLVKMSRPMQRDLHTTIISPAFYAQFSDMDIGRQFINGIHLCPMTETKGEDGFYKKIYSITNSLTNLSPLFSSVLSKCVSILQQHGLLHETESKKLIKSLFEHKAGGLSDTSNIDEAIERIKRLVYDNSHTLSNPLESKVIILRGLPGSGKSYLSKCCSKLSVAICSADNYFIEDGSYKFVPSLLPEAHAQCYDFFLQALIDGKEVVIIDNTNSMTWEYSTYIYISQLFGIKYYVLEIPHLDQHLSAYCSRNLHGIDISSVKIFADRWEKDERAILLPPSLVYPHVNSPGMVESSGISLLDLCKPGYLPNRVLVSSPTLVPVYIGIFLTPESLWKLVSFIPPSHPIIYADHVTLIFQPSVDVIKRAKIGKKVSITVKGLADNSKVQAVTVQLPKGLHSNNKHVHITLSTNKFTHPKFSNDMLESMPASLISDNLKLDGVIGVVVREALPIEVKSGHLLPFDDISSAEFHTILNKGHFTDEILPRLHMYKTSSLEVSVTNKDDSATSDVISICMGNQKITELNVFDFDGTLFETPDRLSGLQLYEKVTGHKWPHKGWFGIPESLLPPLKVKPGPTLAEYHRYFGRAGTYTAILTARIERTESAVRTVLADYQICPDTLILKPQKTQETNPVFKVEALSKLLKKFPDLNMVKFWDDNKENLDAVENYSKTSNVKFEVIDSTRIYPSMSKLLDRVSNSIIGTYLATCGLLPTPEYTAAAQTGINFIASQFCSMTGLHGDPSSYTLVFGSHTLGRKSDVDLCLLAPPHQTPHECVDNLASQLEKCSITHIHKGHGSRCPRLKIMLQFKETPPIDYDIVFAVLSSADMFQTPAISSVGSPEELLLKVNGHESKTALSGPILLHKIQRIIDGFVPNEVFGAVVEMVVQVLTAHRQKGNCYHCIHTFHIVEMLADFIDSHKNEHWSASTIQCDTLFQDFIIHFGQLPLSKWQKRFENTTCVAPEYIIRVSKLFVTLSAILQKNSISLATCFEDVMTRPVFPPAGYTIVKLLYSGSESTISEWWLLQTVMETRLPTFIRQLLSHGLDIIPDGNNNQSSFIFAVEDTKLSRDTVKAVFRKFWSDMSDYRNQKNVKLELEFGGSLEGTSSDITEQFALSELSELHLSASLSSYERLLVHETAERLGIKHKTVGEGNKKHIFLSK